MLNTVLFDMGGTLEDIWNNQETQAKAMDALQKTLQAHGLEPGCSPEEFDRRVMAATSETAEGVWCFTYRSKKNGHTLVLFQPEQRVLETLRTGLSATLQRELDKKLQQG